MWASRKKKNYLQNHIPPSPPLSPLYNTTHHLNGGGVAGTEAAATSGDVESTGAGPRAGAAGASLDGASIEPFFC